MSFLVVAVSAGLIPVLEKSRWRGFERRRSFFDSSDIG